MLMSLATPIMSQADELSEIAHLGYIVRLFRTGISALECRLLAVIARVMSGKTLDQD